ERGLDMAATFAERLRQLRERAGLTQEQLAQASGVNIWTIRGYEQGRREPSWRGLLDLGGGRGGKAGACADCAAAEAAAEPTLAKPGRQGKGSLAGKPTKGKRKGG